MALANYTATANGRPLTWTCESCGMNKDDKDIEVSSINVAQPSGGMISRNFRHCKENVPCIAKAQEELESFKKQVVYQSLQSAPLKYFGSTGSV